MKANIIALGTALLIAVGASAQSTTVAKAATPATAASTHQCLATTDDAAWTSLGVKPDQLTRVHAIQADCKKACGALTAEEKAAKEADVVAKHEADLKAVLTPEQYVNWQKWCATKEGTKAKSESKM
ncbi:MAG: hypothetical protein WAU70_08540 [Flavobacteriales bacterium]